MKWQESDKMHAGERGWKTHNKCAALSEGREEKSLSLLLFTWYQRDGHQAAGPEAK